MSTTTQLSGEHAAHLAQTLTGNVIRARFFETVLARKLYVTGVFVLGEHWFFTGHRARIRHDGRVVVVIRRGAEITLRLREGDRIKILTSS